MVLSARPAACCGREGVNTIDIHFFVFKGIPQDGDEPPFGLRQGAWILACVTDANVESAKQRVMDEIKSRSWIPGPSQPPLSIHNPENKLPELQLLLNKAVYTVIQECLDSPDKGPALAFYRILREGNQLAERLDV